MNGLLVFPTVFNLILNLAIRSSWSGPQSAPGLVFADCIELSIFSCKECNQSDFDIGHLVISMCRFFSCVVGRGCLLWPLSVILNCSLWLGIPQACSPTPGFGPGHLENEKKLCWLLGRLGTHCPPPGCPEAWLVGAGQGGSLPSLVFGVAARMFSSPRRETHPKAKWKERMIQNGPC